MAEKIIWTHQALADYEEIKKYLLSSFGDLAVSEFLFSLNKKLDSIQANPTLYPASLTKKNIRKAVLNKRLIIFYQILPRKKQIAILSLWNTRRNIQKP